MLFQIIDWNDRCIFHDYDSDNNEKKDEAEEKYYYSIQIFGKNEKEQSICLNVINPLIHLLSNISVIGFISF